MEINPKKQYIFKTKSSQFCSKTQLDATELKNHKFLRKKAAVKIFLISQVLFIN